jgi:hypothetical protein
VRVDAVEIDASVTDASGNPVTNLTADDFAILEDRKPQVITSFTLVNVPVERIERPLFGGQPIEPDVLSNQNGEGRLYVFVLDEVAADQALRTRRFLRRFIEQYFGAQAFLSKAIVRIGLQRQVADVVLAGMNLVLSVGGKVADFDAAHHQAVSLDQVEGRSTGDRPTVSRDIVIRVR